MNNLNHTIFLLICVCLVPAGCSESDDQRRFENRAFAVPAGITEMNVNGQRPGQGEYDPDDWEISPMYRLLINFGDFSNSELPYPNPVDLNQNITIKLSMSSEHQVNRFEIYSFRFPSGERYHVTTEEEVSTFNDLLIPAGSIAQDYSGDDPIIYRLLIYDGNQNLITYGDIRVE